MNNDAWVHIGAVRLAPFLASALDPTAVVEALMRDRNVRLITRKEDKEAAKLGRKKKVSHKIDTVDGYEMYTDKTAYMTSPSWLNVRTTYFTPKDAMAAAESAAAQMNGESKGHDNCPLCGAQGMKLMAAAQYANPYLTKVYKNNRGYETMTGDPKLCPVCLLTSYAAMTAPLVAGSDSVSGDNYIIYPACDDDAILADVLDRIDTMTTTNGNGPMNIYDTGNPKSIKTFTPRFMILRLVARLVRMDRRLQVDWEMVRAARGQVVSVKSIEQVPTHRAIYDLMATQIGDSGVTVLDYLEGFSGPFDQVAEVREMYARSILEGDLGMMKDAAREALRSGLKHYLPSGVTAQEAGELRMTIMKMEFEMNTSEKLTAEMQENIRHAGWILGTLGDVKSFSFVSRLEHATTAAAVVEALAQAKRRLVLAQDLNSKLNNGKFDGLIKAIDAGEIDYRRAKNLILVESYAAMSAAAKRKA